MKSEGELRQRLDAGLESLGLPLEGSVRGQLIDYLRLLWRWNRVFNLTAVRDPAQMVTRHLLDSLAVRGYLGGAQHIIDIGSGAGLPGIPLALTMPQSRFILLDGNGKKCRFMVQACAELALAGVEVAHERAELYRPEHLFDCVITRAYGSLAGILSVSAHLLEPHGVVAAMKGVLPEQELEELPSGYSLREVVPYRVPGLESEARHLILLGRDEAER